MKLIKKVAVEGTLEDLLRQTAHGEYIVLCESDTPDPWSAHARGIALRGKNQLLLNGDEVLFAGKFNDWGTLGEDFVILQGDDFEGEQTFLRNGRDVLYKGTYDRWKIHPEGVVVECDKKLFLNGTHLLYEGDFEFWAIHAEGVVVSRDDELFLNGTKKLYEGELFWWESTAQTGLVIDNGDNKLILPTGKCIFVPSNESEDEWQLHEQGVICRIENQFLLYPFSSAT